MVAVLTEHYHTEILTLWVKLAQNKAINSF